MQGRLLGCRTVFTDHSLFGFNEMGGIHINKVREYGSHTSLIKASSDKEAIQPTAL